MDALVKYPDGLSPENYAMISSLTPIIAKEQLLMTESMGNICRDESDRGTYFYINQFILS